MEQPTPGRSGKLMATNDPFIYELLADPNYIVNSDGTIFTRVAETGKVFVDPNQWREVNTSLPNDEGYIDLKYQNRSLRRCRIMYAKFVGPLSQDLIVNHKNSIRNDDSPGNLELITQSGNNFHRFLSKPAVIGNCVLTWEVVDQIRAEKLAGATHKELTVKFGLSKGHISEIVNHKIWIKNKEYTGKQKTCKTVMI